MFEYFTVLAFMHFECNWEILFAIGSLTHFSALSQTRFLTFFRDDKIVAKEFNRLI